MTTAAKSAQTVFLCLREWSNVRNFLQPDMVEVLAASGHRFVILCDEPDNGWLRNLLPHPCFIFEQLKLAEADIPKQTPLRRFFELMRHFTYGDSTYSEMGTRRYHMKIFRDEVVSKANWRGKIYYNIQLWLPLIASRVKLLRTVLREVECKLFSMNSHGELYEKYKPSLLVVPSLGYAYDHYLMREAKSHGTRVLSIVRSWDNTTSKGYTGCMPDHVFAWNDAMAAETIRHHDVPKSRVEVAGIPMWDPYFQDISMRSKPEFLRHFGLDPQKSTIYYAMVGPSNFRHNLTIIRLLLEGIRDGRVAKPSQLLVRIHPNYYVHRGKWLSECEKDEQEMKSLKGEFGALLAISEQDVEELGNAAFLTHANQTHLKEIYSYSDVLVTVYSTQMIEAAIFDLPVINAGFLPLRELDVPISVYDEWDHIRRINATGGVTNTYSEAELFEAINSDLAYPNRLAEERRRLADQEVHAHRGDAGRYSARRLAELA